MDKLERFFKTAGIYFLGNVFTKIVSLLLLPLYTNRIPPNEYGNYGLVISVINLIIPLIFFQIWDGVFRYSFDYKDKENKYIIFYNGLIVMIISSFAFLLFYLMFSFFKNFENKFIILLYSLSIGFHYFYGVLARSVQDNVVFVFSGCINSIITIVLNIVLILFFNKGIEALYISSVIGTLIQIIIIEFKLKTFSNYKKDYFNLTIIKKLMAFSAPLSLTTISYWLLSGLTQLVISLRIDTYANGLYNVANKFSSLLILLIGVFRFAWNEMAYLLYNNKNKKLYYNKTVTEIFRFSIIGCSLILMIIRIIFPYIIGQDYVNALNIIPLLIIGTMANEYAGFLGTIFLANKNSNKLFISTLVSAIINIVGLVILVPKYQLLGAVSALCSAYLIGCIINLIMLYKKEEIRLDKEALISFFTLIISIISFYKVYRIEYFLIITLFLIIIAFLLLKKSILLFIKYIKNILL